MYLLVRCAPNHPRKDLIEPHWTSLNVIKPHRTSLNVIEPHWTSLHLIEPHWTSLNLIGPHWTSLHLTEPHWTSLNLTEPHWTSSNVIEPHWTSLNLIVQTPWGQSMHSICSELAQTCQLNKKAPNPPLSWECCISSRCWQRKHAARIWAAVSNASLMQVRLSCPAAGDVGVGGWSGGGGLLESGWPPCTLMNK